MKCVVTAGPTYEPLDEVRRLTNFSTGRLGSELAEYLTLQGQETTLLIGQHATWPGERKAQKVKVFTTTTDLRDKLRALSRGAVDAVFHAAAVSDFAFGKIWLRSPDGALTEVKSGKISTREGSLLAELVPTAKLIIELRDWFPKARLVGWKYEVEGDRAGVIRLAKRQIAESRTDACVANGPGYGVGFGLVRAAGRPAHFRDKRDLFAALEKLAAS